jgi:L-rhamnose mutarotase
MLFIAQLTHSPELCLGRPEHKEKAKELMEWIKNCEKYENEAGVKANAIYLNANEHTFFLILEADNYSKISKFLAIGPILTHHTAKITPVVGEEEILEFGKKILGE